MSRDDLLDAFTLQSEDNVSIITKLCTPRGRMRSGRRARLEDLKTASREGGEAWKTSKERGDIAHLTSHFSYPTLTRWGQRFLKGGG